LLYASLRLGVPFIDQRAASGVIGAGDLADVAVGRLLSQMSLANPPEPE